MKILVVSQTYAIAGVPLAQIRFAKSLAARGHDVTLMFGYIPAHLDLPVVESVSVRVLGRKNVRSMTLPIIRYLRDSKPDVVFSAEDHLTAIVLIAAILSGSRAKISGSSRILPTDRLAYSKKFFSKGTLLKALMSIVMWRADALTCVSKDMVLHYRRIFRNAPHVCVYNIVVDAATQAKMSARVDHEWLLHKDMPVVIAAGTFTKRKGFADLIDAMAIVNVSRATRLILLGDGPLRSILLSRVRELGIADRVSMPGNVANPLKDFKNADVFVLSSYSEGMPNVLVEAMACGCTPVAADCPTGPRELLDDGVAGYLVPMKDPEQMACAILRAIERPIDRSVLTAAVQPFTADAVIDRHFEVLGISQVRGELRASS